MISLEKCNLLTPLQNLPRNVGDLGEIIIDKGFKKLPKVQKIAKTGHTALREHLLGDDLLLSFVEWKPFYICKFYLTALVTLRSIVTTYYPFI